MTKHAEPDEPEAPHARLDAPLLLLLLFAIFLASPNRHMTDSRFALLVSHAFAHSGRLALDAYAPQLRSVSASHQTAGPLPYQLAPIGGQVHYIFPPGTSLLMTPVAAALAWLDAPIVDANGRHDDHWETKVQHVAASAAMALLTLFFFQLARLFHGRSSSAMLALAAALATPIWSTAAATLWSHTLSVLLLGAALLTLTRAESYERPPAAGRLGSLLAWMFCVRPTMALSIAAITIYTLLRWKRPALALLPVGAVWLGLFLLGSQLAYGTPLPPYFRPGRLDALPLPEALLGNLVSPARGALVYMPWLLPAAFIVARRWRQLPLRGLATTGLLVTLVHFGIVSSYPHWWAGHSWGARFMTDLVPWWLLIGTSTLAASSASEPAAARVSRPACRRPALRRLLALGLIIAVLMNAAGVLSDACKHWNATPTDIDSHPERLWDWHDPPFLRWAQPRPAEPAAQRFRASALLIARGADHSSTCQSTARPA